MKQFFLLPILIIIFFSCGKHSTDCHLLFNSFEVDTIKLNKKVLVLGLDGVRSDALDQNNSPFMFALSARDDVYFTASHSVESITYSGPNWSSILTGVHHDKHGVIGNNFEQPNFACYPTFFDYIESVDSSIHTASIVNWTPINTHILTSSTDFSPLTPLSDHEVYENLQNLLINDSPFNADVIFVHFDELDAAGHSFGFSSDVQEYSSTLNTLDNYVKNLFNTINTKRLAGEDWLIMVVSDHGGDGTGHSDANNPNINQTIFFAQHPSLVFKNQYISSQADLAPTILDFLGISNPNFDSQTDGISLFEK